MSPLFNIITPENFKKVPWKNGLGHTLELATSAGGSIDNFDWRLSIATVNSEGVFSDFSGYLRNLVLIKGEGITLTHDDVQVDDLNELLEFACFDGASRTVSRLHNGAIEDFNIMTNPQKYHAEVSTFTKVAHLNFIVNELAFIYCLEEGAVIHHKASGQSATIDKNNLLAISVSGVENAHNVFSFSGKMAILVKFNRTSL